MSTVRSVTIEPSVLAKIRDRGDMASIDSDGDFAFGFQQGQEEPEPLQKRRLVRKLNSGEINLTRKECKAEKKIRQSDF